jgi:diadenosine tetraphosphate (Ap4A) HIT family hydrolase
MTGRMTLYEDALVRAELAPDAASHGHVLVTPQRSAQHLGDLSEEESAHLFLVASYTASILFQGLKSEGTNIIVEEGSKGHSLVAHIIARKADDGLSFAWQPQKAGDDKDILDRIKDKTFLIGRRKSAPQEESAAEEPEEPTKDLNGDEALRDEEEQENYLIKQLIRIP